MSSRPAVGSQGHWMPEPLTKFSYNPLRTNPQQRSLNSFLSKCKSQFLPNTQCSIFPNLSSFQGMAFTLATENHLERSGLSCLSAPAGDEKWSGSSSFSRKNESVVMFTLPYHYAPLGVIVRCSSNLEDTQLDRWITLCVSYTPMRWSKVFLAEKRLRKCHPYHYNLNDK